MDGICFLCIAEKPDEKEKEKKKKKKIEILGFWPCFYLKIMTSVHEFCNSLAELSGAFHVLRN